MKAEDNLRLDYRVAFLRYLARREEAALHRGYEIGHSAVIEGMSILDVAQTHHQVFLEVLRDTPSEDLTQVVAAASEFFLEVLATYDMTQRTLLQHRPRAVAQPVSGPDASERGT